MIIICVWIWGHTNQYYFIHYWYDFCFYSGKLKEGREQKNILEQLRDFFDVVWSTFLFRLGIILAVPNIIHDCFSTEGTGRGIKCVFFFFFFTWFELPVLISIANFSFVLLRIFDLCCEHFKLFEPLIRNKSITLTLCQIEGRIILISPFAHNKYQKRVQHVLI